MIPDPYSDPVKSVTPLIHTSVLFRFLSFAQLLQGKEVKKLPQCEDTQEMRIFPAFCAHAMNDFWRVQQVITEHAEGFNDIRCKNTFFPWRGRAAAQASIKGQDRFFP